jgi:hypothetical protein
LNRLFIDLYLDEDVNVVVSDDSGFRERTTKTGANLS